jgi:hypothetical protein
MRSVIKGVLQRKMANDARHVSFFAIAEAHYQ